MQIIFDAELKRATDVDSGIAVEFDHYGPFAQERDMHFNLILNGKIIPFDATYDYNEDFIRKKNPTATFSERAKILINENRINVRISNFSPDFFNLNDRESIFPSIFVNLVCYLLSEIEKKHIFITYKPNLFHSYGEWSAQS